MKHVGEERETVSFYRDYEAFATLTCGEADSGLYYYLEGEDSIMAQAKLYAFHAEADELPELAKIMRVQLAKMDGAQVVSGKPAATPKPDTKETGKAAAAGPKLSLETVKNALTKLKEAIDEKEGADAKKGVKMVKTVLKKFGVTACIDLTEEQYPEITKAIAVAMPGAEEGDGEEF